MELAQHGLRQLISTSTTQGFAKLTTPWIPDATSECSQVFQERLAACAPLLMLVHTRLNSQLGLAWFGRQRFAILEQIFSLLLPGLRLMICMPFIQAC